MEGIMAETAAQQGTRPGRKPKPVFLDPEDERLLQVVVESPYWSSRQVRRAKVVLAMASGARIVALIEELKLSRAEIQRICRKFERDGVVGLLMRPLKTGTESHRHQPGPLD
jgi:hypothetical protein